MLFLIGCFLFLGIHMVSLFPKLREIFILRFSFKYFKITYSLLAACGLMLLLTNFQEPGIFIKGANSFFYDFRFFIHSISNILIISSFVPNNLFKYLTKNPLLLGFGLWAFSHFMVNQHENHLYAFGFLFFFSLIMLMGIILRKEKNKIPQKFNLKNTIIVLVIGLLTTYFLSLLHQTLTGVSIL